MQRLVITRDAFVLLFVIAGSGSARAATADTADYVFADSFESRDCSAQLTCSAPSSGKSCVAGQLTDAATLQPLRSTFNIGLPCGHGAIGGPCDLAVGAFDAIAYASNPVSAPPLPHGDQIVDGCGRFRITDITPPVSGSAALAASDAPGGEGHVTGAVVRALGPNAQVGAVDLDSPRTETVAAWSLAGQVDLSQGALLLTFVDAGIPTAGVAVLRDGSSAGFLSRYFSDADSERLDLSAVATTTGVNGSAVVASATFGTYGGTGGEGVGCHWQSAAASSIPGVVLFFELGCVP